MTSHRREAPQAEKYMKRMPQIAIAFGLALTIAGAAFAYSGEQYAKDAKITMAQARQIALKARPGQITDQELEQESGGSGLRYSFDIRSGKVTHEVGVDARTAKVLENSAEGPNPD